MELIKRIYNPLTIVAIFASIAEIAGTAVLPVLSIPLQSTFIWFVMLFPVILLLLFFWTLHSRPSVLYAPSDFRDDANYLKVLSGVSIDLDAIEESVQLIVNEAENKIGMAGQKEREIIRQELKNIKATISNARASVAELPAIDRDVRKNIELNKKVIMVALQQINEPADFPEITAATSLDDDAVIVAIVDLMREGYIRRKNGRYLITDKTPNEI